SELSRRRPTRCGFAGICEGGIVYDRRILARRHRTPLASRGCRQDPVYAIIQGGDQMKTSVGQATGILSVATILVGLVLFPVTDGWAQQKAAHASQQIVGIWKLVSSVNTAKDGTVTKGI